MPDCPTCGMYMPEGNKFCCLRCYEKSLGEECVSTKNEGETE